MFTYTGFFTQVQDGNDLSLLAKLKTHRNRLRTIPPGSLQGRGWLPSMECWGRHLRLDFGRLWRRRIRRDGAGRSY